MDRGWTPLDADGIGPELAAALKAEARRRVQAGSFFGYIAYAGLTARKRAGREMTAGACQASDLGFCCGAGGIRTPGTLACPAAFKAAAINQTLPPLQPVRRGQVTGRRPRRLCYLSIRNRLRPGYTACHGRHVAQAAWRIPVGAPRAWRG